MKHIYLIIAIALTTSVSPPLFAQQKPAPQAEAKKPLPTIEQVTKTLDDMYKSKSSRAKMTMTIVNDRGTRKLELESWSLGKDESLIVIRAPARERGTATLRTKEGLWNYAPRADRLIRIPAGMLSDSWMGSNFTNDDLVRESSYSDDYEAKLSWGSGADEGRIVATFTPRPDAPVVYTRLVFVLQADNYVPLRADYYDEGELVRRMEFSEIKDVAGKPVAHRMELKPMSGKNKGEKTVVQYDELEFDLDVSQEMFTKRGLRRVAKKR